MSTNPTPTNRTSTKPLPADPTAANHVVPTKPMPAFPAPRPRRPSVRDILHRIKPSGWVISAVLFLLTLAVILDAVCQNLHPIVAGLLAAVFIGCWHHIVYRQARFDAYGALILASDNFFPDDDPSDYT